MAVASLVLAVSFGCKVGVKAGYYADDKKAALAALEVFHSRFSAGEFDAIYDNVGDALRSTPKSELLASMKATRDKWGKLTKAEVKSASCFPGEVRLLVQAQFDKGEAGEMIVWQLQNDKARLQHFRIFPGHVDVPAGASNECRSP